MLERVRQAAQPGTAVSMTFTVSVQPLSAGLGSVPVLRLSSVAPLNPNLVATDVSNTASGDHTGGDSAPSSSSTSPAKRPRP